MRTIALLSIILLGEWAIAGEPKPTSVDAALHTVATTGLHRFLEYRICSPEHCWSKGFLQWSKVDQEELQWEATAEIRELGYGKSVDSVRWVPSGKAFRLEIRVSPSHSGFEPYTLVINPDSPGRYTASGQK